MTATERWPRKPHPRDTYVQVTLDIEPLPKTRARISPAEYTTIGDTRVKTKNAHGYSRQAVREYEQKVGWLLRQARVQRNEVDDLGVHVIFYVRGRQRRDLDNLIKALLDACNKVAWRDDQQVTRLTSEIVRDSDSPRIDLMIYVTHRRARGCAKCGKPLTSKQLTGEQVFCSKVCYDTEQRRGTYRTCVVCGTAVYRQVGKARAANTYCSPECRIAGRGTCRVCGGKVPKPASWKSSFCSTACSVTWHRDRALAPKSAPQGTCSDCGSPTYSLGSKRCRACQIAHVAANGHNTTRGPAYDECPDCGGRKRVTAERCMACFHVAMRARKAGRWKGSRELAAIAGLRIAEVAGG